MQDSASTFQLDYYTSEAASRRIRLRRCLFNIIFSAGAHIAQAFNLKISACGRVGAICASVFLRLHVRWVNIQILKIKMGGESIFPLNSRL